MGGGAVVVYYIMVMYKHVMRLVAIDDTSFYRTYCEWTTTTFIIVAYCQNWSANFQHKHQMNIHLFSCLCMYFTFFTWFVYIFMQYIHSYASIEYLASVRRAGSKLINMIDFGMATKFHWDFHWGYLSFCIILIIFLV